MSTPLQMEGNQQQSFRLFGDQLRLQTSTFANLSINDSIWSTSFPTKRSDQRRNFDVRVGGEIVAPPTHQKSPDFVRFNDSWNVHGDSPLPRKIVDVNGGFNKGVYSKLANLNHSIGVNHKVSKNVGARFNDDHGGKESRKNNNSSSTKNTATDNNSKSSADKRFKTLPPSESLPRNERIGGYIFVCNNDTMEENLKRKLFGLPPRYRDSVRAITPGLPLFLYNYSTHQLHGVFEAASFGGTNMDMLAWEDKKCPGESRFPAQVRVVTRNICEPLEEDSFRPILHHYDGPKFRLELNVAEALSLLDIFAENKG